MKDEDIQLHLTRARGEKPQPPTKQISVSNPGPDRGITCGISGSDGDDHDYDCLLG